MKTSLMALIATAMLASPTLAWAQRGPVATACASDIEQFCKGVPHVNRAARQCLEKNKDNVAAACRQALESTGGGRGGGRQTQSVVVVRGAWRRVALLSRRQARAIWRDAAESALPELRNKSIAEAAFDQL